MAGIFNSTDEIPIVGPESIMFEMVDRDLKYVRSGRPLSEASAGDKHSSFIRDYVVFGRPTGMKVYDDLFDKMKPTLKENLEDHDIKMLVKEWETKHPGQTFFPEHWNP